MICHLTITNLSILLFKLSHTLLRLVCVLRLCNLVVSFRLDGTFFLHDWFFQLAYLNLDSFWLCMLYLLLVERSWSIELLIAWLGLLFLHLIFKLLCFRLFSLLPDHLKDVFCVRATFKSGRHVEIGGGWRFKHLLLLEGWLFFWVYPYLVEQFLFSLSFDFWLHFLAFFFIEGLLIYWVGFGNLVFRRFLLIINSSCRTFGGWLKEKLRFVLYRLVIYRSLFYGFGLLLEVTFIDGCCISTQLSGILLRNHSCLNLRFLLLLNVKKIYFCYDIRGSHLDRAQVQCRHYRFVSCVSIWLVD